MGVNTDSKDVLAEFAVKKKGFIRTILDDHRDASMLRHALFAVYLKLTGKSSGKTPHYTDETGLVRAIFEKIYRLNERIEELEAKVKKYEEKGVCLR
jgi:hypothetical protein